MPKTRSHLKLWNICIETLSRILISLQFTISQNSKTKNVELGIENHFHFTQKDTLLNWFLRLSFHISPILFFKLNFFYLKPFKELSFCHKLWFSNFNIVATQCRRPLIFQAMNAARSYNVSLKYQMSTSSGCKDIGITKIEFVKKTQFLWQFS